MDLITQKVCMTRDLGVHGNLFGGNMLSWIDEAAGLQAAKICRTPNMVTLKMEEVIFKKPVKVGFIINIYGKITRMGKSSITLLMEARKHNVRTEEETPVCTTCIVFVRIDKMGNPSPIDSTIRDKYKHL
ncbi:MAG: acyl-CoA thioesterase [Bacteroidetes bacterium]|nr:MAG: acyl-CoA thioesterase [Bacteroidota bacterium]